MAEVRSMWSGMCRFRPVFFYHIQTFFQPRFSSFFTSDFFSPSYPIDRACQDLSCDSLVNYFMLFYWHQRKFLDYNNSIFCYHRFLWQQKVAKKEKKIRQLSARNFRESNFLCTPPMGRRARKVFFSCTYGRYQPLTVEVTPRFLELRHEKLLVEAGGRRIRFLTT